MNGLRRGVLSVVSVLMAFVQGAALAAAPTAAEDAASRARIRSERQRANADYAAREADCKRRFVVASCLSEAAASRRTTLERLQEQEAVINERQRAGRADVASQRVADKKEAMRKAAIEKEAAARAAAEKPAAAAGKPSPAPPSAGAASAASGEEASTEEGAAAVARPRKPPTPSRKQPTPSNLPSVEKREKARTDYERRLQDAEKHRQEVETRNAANAAKKKPGNPLPLPDAP